MKRNIVLLRVLQGNRTSGRPYEWKKRGVIRKWFMQLCRLSLPANCRPKTTGDVVSVNAGEDNVSALKHSGRGSETSPPWPFLLLRTYWIWSVRIIYFREGNLVYSVYWSKYYSCIETPSQPQSKCWTKLWSPPHGLVKLIYKISHHINAIKIA